MTSLIGGSYPGPQNTGAGGGAAWTPASLSVAPSVWVDAQTSGSITQSGGVVSQINDLSGNANHFTASGSVRPAYSATGLNSLPCLDFDGSDDKMINGLTHNATTLSIFVVYSHDSSDNGRVISLASSSNDDYDNVARMCLKANGGVERAFGGPAITPTTNSIVSLVFDSVNGYMWLNGAVVPDSEPSTGSFNFTRAALGGAAKNGGGDFYNGRLGEVVILPYAADFDVQDRIEGYLAHRWGLTSGLPSIHPYKSTGPTT